MRSVVLLILGLVLVPLAVLGVDVAYLPQCEQCCRICTNNPIDHLDDAFGITPPPVEASSSLDGSVSVLPGLRIRPDTKPTDKCCNVCPGFGVGHPHPMYASFLETGEEPVVAPSKSPYGFRLPPCCSTCKRDSGLGDLATLMTSVHADHMADAPKANDYYKENKAGLVFLEADADADVDADAEEDADMDAEAEDDEELETFFMQLDARAEATAAAGLQTHAQFELFMGMSDATPTNPEGFCRQPRDFVPQQGCCKSCTAESVLFFPNDVRSTLIARMHRERASATPQQRVQRLVRQLVEQADGDYSAAYDLALGHAQSLRQQMKSRRAARGVDYHTHTQYEIYRDFINRAMDKLAVGQNTPKNTLLLKVLNALNKRLFTRMNPTTPNKLGDYAQGIASNVTHQVFTAPEYHAIASLPSNLQVLANLMLQDDDVRVHLDDIELPYPVAYPHPSYEAPRANGHMPSFPKLFIPRTHKKHRPAAMPRPYADKITSFRRLPPVAKPPARPVAPIPEPPAEEVAAPESEEPEAMPAQPPAEEAAAPEPVAAPAPVQA